MNRGLGRTAAGLTLVTALACGGESSTSNIRLEGMWARAMPALSVEGGPGANSAVYGRISNRGPSDDRLTGGRIDVAEAVEIHESVLDGDVMRMRQVGELTIPPDSAVDLRPGAIHLMLLGLRESLKAGETLHLTLHFQRAGDVQVEVPVRSLDGR